MRQWSVPIAIGIVALAGCAGPKIASESLPLRPSDRCEIDLAEGALRGLDIAIAINTSTSTSRPSGEDIDQDGEIGELRQSVVTDRGDSLLAGQVAAVRSLLYGGALQDARVAIIVYSGLMRAPQRSLPAIRIPHRAGRMLTGLTVDRDDLDAALDRALARGSRGAVDLAAAVELSLRGLRGESAADPARRRVILLVSNSVTPVLGAPSVANFRKELGGDPNGSFLRDDPELVTAARRAIRYETTVHSFAIGPAARQEEPHHLGRLARATGGTYRDVDELRELDCEMLRALVTPGPPRTRDS